MEDKKVTGEEIVRIAEKYLGIPYKWGGSHSDGIDCSHLVWRVYEEAGLSYSYTQTKDFDSLDGRDFKEVISPQEGDVVLFKKHIGIYTRGDIISAQSGAKKVKLGKISWFSNFVGYYRHIKVADEE